MITNKAYFKLENPNERNILKKILEESFQEISINWLNDVATLETVNKENYNYAKFYQLHFWILIYKFLF